MDIGKMTEAQIMALLDDGDGNQIADAVDATVGWENISLDGKPAEYSSDNARRLYQKYPAIAAEVQAFIGNRANFFS